MKPIAAACVFALAVLATAGCNDVFLSKESRQRIDRIKSAVREDASAVDAPDEDGQPPLHRAVLDGYTSLIDWLLDRRASLNTRNREGLTPLHLAVIVDGQATRGILNTLIRRGADLGAGNSDGSTPLHVAAGFGRRPAILALLDAGANPRLTNMRGDTPLHLAATPQPDRSPEDCREIVLLLTAHGADINARNAFGMAPLHMAAMAGHVPVLRALIDAGARIDPEGPDGWTPLHVAAASGRALVVEELLARGAQVSRRDRDGKTPLAVVVERIAIQPRTAHDYTAKLAQVSEVLRRHGAR